MHSQPELESPQSRAGQRGPSPRRLVISQDSLESSKSHDGTWASESPPTSAATVESHSPKFKAAMTGAVEATRHEDTRQAIQGLPANFDLTDSVDSTVVQTQQPGKCIWDLSAHG